MSSPLGAKIIKIFGPACTVETFNCGSPAAAFWLINVATPLFSTCCSLVVIIDVVSRLLQKRSKVRMGAEKLMTQLVLMVSVVDLCFTTMWCGLRLAAVGFHNSKQYNHNVFFFFIAVVYTLQHMSHITLAAHLYAWSTRKASPAKLAQNLPQRLIVLVIVVIALAAMASCLPSVAKREIIRHVYILLGPISTITIALLYRRAFAAMKRSLPHKEKDHLSQHSR